MRRHHGGRGAPPRGFQGQAPHAPPHPSYAANPPLPPPRGPVSGGFRGPPRAHAPSASAALERDVSAFLHGLRASRSDAQAPPNALNVRDAIQAVCAQFGTAAYDELCGAAPHQLAALRQIQAQHERVWAFVTCYVHARRVHTLYECHLAFLQSEGIAHFGGLGIGNSFVHTDAVQALYHAPAAIYRLTTKDVLSAFRQFENVLGHDAFAIGNGSGGHHHHHARPPQRIDRDQFKQFLAQQRRQPSAEAMGLYIDPEGFGPYIAMLRRVAKKEQREIHELQEEFNKGIADRVFELSKEKFSAENRQHALAELLQRTNDERALELARGGSDGSTTGTSRRLSAKKATATLSSLSLEILNRVTDVDVYLDNVLRWKSADERFKARLGAHQIADTDRKIRMQLTQFLLASQKSRHHARVKVVTWVLCGVLAKIHTLLQLDDKLPDDAAAPPAKGAAAGGEKNADATKEKKDDDDGDDDDEGEECDCCCVGEDTCRCRCQCECHQDASDDEGAKPAHEAADAKSSQPVETQASDPASPTAKRKRSRSRSDSVAAAAAASPTEILASLQMFLTERLDAADRSLERSEGAVKLLAQADAHLRATYGDRVSNFSLLEQVVQAMEATTQDEQDSADTSDALRQVAECLRTAHALGGEPGGAVSSVSTDEIRDFVLESFSVVARGAAEVAPTAAAHKKAIVHQACEQFGISRVDERACRWLEEVVDGIAKDVAERGTTSVERGVGGSSVLHYAGVLALRGAVRLAEGEGSASNELAMMQDETARDQVVASKTAEAQAALRRCPFLADVGEWTHWRSRFAPFCGPLGAFLRSHEMIRACDDHADSAAEFVCCTNGRVVKVRGRDEVSASALDAAEISPEALAVVLVSLFVQHRGCEDDFPRELVLLHLRTILKHEASSGGGSRRAEGSTDDDVAAPQAAYVYEAVQFVPHDFAPFVLGLLEEAARPLRLEEEVLKVAHSGFEQRQLQVLGGYVAKDKWTQSSWVGKQQATRAIQSVATQQPRQPTLSAASSSVALSSVTEPATTHEASDAVELVERLDADTCRQFIHKLRRDQFGVGLEIADADTRAVLQAQHRRLERALKRLSDELYSEKTHFVLELLQNADDNRYPRGVVPRSEFVLTHDGKIIFSNNEMGFSEANVQAICDVGASTKEHEQGDKRSIGKKGIGFKSVFKVSDTPEVHSNGFHIQFHAKDEQVGRGLGYILPYWVEDRGRWRDAAGTTFVLPLNEHSVQRQQEISASLLSFEPSVLLFLQKIRELRLTNEVTGGRLVYAKHEETVATIGATQTTISVATLRAERVSTGADGDDSSSVKTTAQRWFIVRRQVAIPKAFQERGDHTEIAIAVPDLSGDEDQEDDDATRRPALQQVFCYLPLRSYGFRFIVQGDFEVPSSREAISNGSDWNQWLVAQYPSLVPTLASQVGALKLSLRDVLRVLPLDSDVQAPFRSIVGDISREMRQLRCFPTAASDALCTAGELLDASEFAEDDETAFLVSDAALVRGALVKSVMDMALARSMPTLLKAQLRIERLRASHVLRLLAHVAPRHDGSVVLKLLHLLAKLARHDRHRVLLLQELRRIKCFPVRVGASVAWLSLADVHGVLFIRSLRAKVPSSSLLVDDLSVLDDTFVAALEDSFPDTRRFLIEQLGVKELADHDLIIHHILPAMAMAVTTTLGLTESAKLKWREHVKFLAAHLASCGAACPSKPLVRRAMQAVTWRGQFVDCGEETSTTPLVVLPSTTKRLEGSVAWLRQRLAAVDAAAVDFDVVALDEMADVDSDALRSLWFDTCGLPELFDPRDTRAHAALRQAVQWVQREEDAAVKRQVSSELAKWMDAAWSASIPSDSSAWWQRAAWLEGSDGQFYRPSELWVASPSLSSLFASTMVATTRVTFESPSLRAAWHLKTIPAVDDVLTVIKKLAAAQKEDGDESSEDVDVSQMARLYAFLLQESRRDELPTAVASVRAAFASASLIYLPASEEEDVETRFAGIDGVVWSNGSGVAASVAASLEDVYPKALRPFFVGVCGVERKPTLLQLEQVLTGQLEDPTSVSKRIWTSRVLPILRLLAKTLRKGKLSATQTKSLTKTLKKLAWIPIVGSGEFQLVSMKSCKHSPLAFADGEDERDMQRLCVALVSENDEERVESMVKLVEIGGDDEVLADLAPLLRHVGAVSINESLLREPVQWCKWLAKLGGVAFVNAKSPSRRRTRKRFEKLLKRVLQVWAAAWRSGSDTADASSGDSPLRDETFRTDLSTLPLFPGGANTPLLRGVDLFLNDQAELSQEQFQTATVRVLGLYGWDHFVATADDEDSHKAATVKTLLLEAAQVRSLAQHLHTEVVLLGPQHDAADAAFTTAFRGALAVAQRVVFHHHPSVYTRLDHTALRQLLATIKIVEVTGDSRALQLLHRVATTDFTLRQSVACHLDKQSGRVFVVAASESPALLFDVFREVARQCVGSAVATSVANVLYLASMQPTPAALEAWLVGTQKVSPLDARAGKTLWVDADADVAANASHKRARHRAEADATAPAAGGAFRGDDRDDVEDGEVEDDADAVPAAKRARQHAWESDVGGGTPSTSSSSGWQDHPPYQGAGAGAYHHHGAYPPPPPNATYAQGRAPPSLSAGGGAMLQSLAFSGPGASTNGLSDEEKLAIGRWGEEYVYLQLKQSYADRPEVCVDWVNAQDESGLPYDIVVKTGASHDVEYVEVKSTKTMEKGVFEISMNELDQAATHGSKYSIYRVFNAGNAALCRVVRMKNPIALVRQKKISLVLLMQ